MRKRKGTQKKTSKKLVISNLHPKYAVMNYCLDKGTYLKNVLEGNNMHGHTEVIVKCKDLPHILQYSTPQMLSV